METKHKPGPLSDYQFIDGLQSALNICNQHEVLVARAAELEAALKQIDIAARAIKLNAPPRAALEVKP